MAIIFCGLSVYHAFYMIFTRRGRYQVKAFLPAKKDFSDVIDLTKHNLSLTPVKPKLNHYSYIEKAEYWALVWGVSGDDRDGRASDL